jgi:deoxyribodipyrimidine photolyase
MIAFLFYAGIKNKLHFFGDSFLSEPDNVLKTDGKPYQVFTPFFNKVKNLRIPIPADNNYKNYYSENVNGLLSVDQLKEKYFNKGLNGY